MPSVANSSVPSIDWIPEVAEPYLRGYHAQRQARGTLQGYWFFAASDGSPRKGRARTRSRSAKDAHGATAGFFVGYLANSRGWAFLSPQTPECLVFAFVLPISGTAHTDLVSAQDSLLRKTFDYIRYLTHRPPRFQFFEGGTPALIRHIPLQTWPARRIRHYARNFYIETLAWLVRSAVVRKLRADL